MLESVESIESVKSVESEIKQKSCHFCKHKGTLQYVFKNTNKEKFVAFCKCSHCELTNFVRLDHHYEPRLKLAH